MSLLDDVSIVVTPNGYKAGELYAVVPVPTEGAEEVTNGDFATDSDWSKGGGATISGGQANIDGDGTSFASITQSNVFTEGKRYKVTADVIITSGLGLKFQDGANNENIGFATTTGSYEFYFIATSNTSFVIGRRTGGTAFDSSVTSVSVKEYTSADMDVTRATAATRVDEDGLVNYAEVLGGEEVTNGDFATDLSGWSNKSSTSTWVSGSARIDNSIGNANSGLFQDIGLILGKTYTLTATLKLISADSNGNFVVLTSNSGGGGQTIIYTGNALVIGGASVTETIEFTTADSDVSIQLACNTTNAVFEIDNVSVKEVTRDNVPRIDYTGGGCPHILAEPQRTNLITYSEDFSQWTAVGSPTLTPDYGLSPDGTENSTRIELSANARIYKGLSASGDIAFSVYLKGSGVITLRDNTNVYRQDVTLSSEWARYDLYFNATITNVQIQNQTASVVDCELWGAQTEIGSYATSYIPTSGSTVTRNQDIFTRDGIGSLINSTEGVLFVEMAALSNDGTNRGISLNDGTSSNRLLLYFSAASNQIAVISTGFAGSIIYTLPDETLFNKIAVRYKANDITLWVDGASRGTPITSATIPTFTAFKFDSGSASSPFFGKVKQLQVYNTVLTDEQLLQLTGTSGTDFYESYAEMASALTYTIQ